MTPKIARFLAQHQPATPCLVLDVDRVEENFRALRDALPLARIYYAVKANPAPQILQRPIDILQERSQCRGHIPSVVLDPTP